MFDVTNNLPHYLFYFYAYWTDHATLDALGHHFL